MGTQMATTGTDYGSLFRPRARTQAQRDADAEAQRRSGDYSSNTATRNNAPSAGDQRGGENRGVDASRNFKARQKNMEYKDEINNLRQLQRLATESNGRLTFPTTELKNKYINSLALAKDYETNNTQCDLGNSQACGLAGRGSFPTDYPSPFTDSIHYNANSYFGVGDGSLEERQSKRSQEDTTVAIAGDGQVETSQERMLRLRREREEAEEERMRKENENADPPIPTDGIDGNLPTPSGDGSGGEPVLPSPPAPKERPATTDGSGDNLKPKSDGTHSGASGGGDTDGSRGGASGGEPTHIVPLNPSNDGIIGYPRMPRRGFENMNYPSVFNNRKCL